METQSLHPLEIFFTQNSTLELLQYQWLDLGGILRTIILTKEYALSLTNSPLKTSPVTLALLPQGDYEPGFTGIGSDELWPDWTSLRVCSYLGDRMAYASVMCFISETGKAFQPRTRCPRSILKRALEDASHIDQLQFKVGFEIEFFFFEIKDDGTISTPLNSIGGWSSGIASTHPLAFTVLDEIMQCLAKINIKALKFHAESGKGQYEIALGPSSVMEAIDTLIFAKEAVRIIALKHGLRATMFPTPSEGSNFNGAHVHLSIDDPSQKKSDCFLAGVLERLSEMCAFSMPNYDSYERVGDFKGTIGTAVAWGTENKDLAVRKIRNRIGYWEIRCADFTANMYLVLGAWITAGSLGVREKSQLWWKDLQMSPCLMSSSALAEYGIDTYLPKSLGEALEALETAVLEGKLEPLGKEFLDSYLAFKIKEESSQGVKTIAERREMFLFLF